MIILDDFYKVGYIYDGKQNWAVYFNLESAQEAMVKMIHRGLEVTELKSQKLTRGDNMKGVHMNTQSSGLIYYTKLVINYFTMKPIHYFSIFVIGFVGGWGIVQIEKKNSSAMYEYPSVCEVLGKNHPECK